MNIEQAYSPHGAALLDCFRGETSAMLICHQDGVRDDVPAAFWLRETMGPLEALGLDLCRGRVLDVGAGQEFILSNCSGEDSMSRPSTSRPNV